MPDTSDILKDPTAKLEMALEEGALAVRVAEFESLHRHLLAGGALPEQWRDQGTVLAELAWGVTAAAGLLERNGFTTTADMLRHRMAAVTGEG